MKAGNLTERITLQSFSSTRDAYGGEVRTWSDVATVWAQADPWRARERVSARRQMGEATVSFLMRAPLAVSLGKRIVWQSLGYDVIEIDASRKHAGELIVYCRAEDASP